MKKIRLSLLALAAAFSWGMPAQANVYQEIILADLETSVALERAEKNVINWRVGERSEYKMKASIGNLGFVWHAVLWQRGIRDRASLIIHC